MAIARIQNWQCVFFLPKLVTSSGSLQLMNKRKNVFYTFVKCFRLQFLDTALQKPECILKSDL